MNDSIELRPGEAADAVYEIVIAEENGTALAEVRLPRNLRRHGYPADYLKLREELKRLLEKDQTREVELARVRDTAIRWQVIVAQILLENGGSLSLEDKPLKAFPDALEFTHDPSSRRTTLRAVFYSESPQSADAEVGDGAVIN